MESTPLVAGCDARWRGERVSLRHVLHVPRSCDLFGSPIRPSFRATVVFDDGRFAECDLFELQPIDA